MIVYWNVDRLFPTDEKFQKEILQKQCYKFLTIFTATQSMKVKMKLEFEEKTLTVFPHANPLCKNEYLPTNLTDPQQIEHSGPIKEELTFDIFVKEEVKYTNVETVTREDLLNVNKIIPLTRRNISLGKANLVKSDENENSNENKSILKKSKRDVHQNESIKCDTIDVCDLVN